MSIASGATTVTDRHARPTNQTTADTWFYTELAEGNVLNRIADEPDLARIFRFHPTTVVMATGWMKIVGPLKRWIEPIYLLKGMFPAVGAVGVWAAMWAFAAVVPRGYAILWGLIYASSLGVWYFSSIEESKIVSATLSTLYIATYLHLRNKWTMRGAVLLTASRTGKPPCLCFGRTCCVRPLLAVGLSH